LTFTPELVYDKLMGSQNNPPGSLQPIAEPTATAVIESFKTTSGAEAQIAYIFCRLPDEPTRVAVEIGYSGQASEADRLEAVEHVKGQLRSLNPAFEFHARGLQSEAGADKILGQALFGRKGEA